MNNSSGNDWITAEELVNRLEADSAYQKLMAEKEARRAKAMATNEEAEKPIIQELGSIGIQISSISDYINSDRILSPKETEILLCWLPKVTSKDIKDAIVRSLCSTQTEFDGRPLAELFESARDFHDDDLRWTIANTIALGKTTGLTDWVVEAIQNSKYVDAREMLCYAVVKMLPIDEAIKILQNVFDDLSIHAAGALGAIAKDKSVIEFLDLKRDEFASLLSAKKHSPYRQNKLKSTIKAIDAAIKKIKKRIQKQ